MNRKAGDFPDPHGSATNQAGFTATGSDAALVAPSMRSLFYWIEHALARAGWFTDPHNGDRNDSDPKMLVYNVTSFAMIVVAASNPGLVNR